MAFPTIETTNYGSTAGGSTHAINMPAGITIGDLLLVFFATDGDNTVTNWGGFTELGQASNGTASFFAVGYKIATGSDTLTLTVSVTNEPGSHVTYRISGHDSGQAPEISTVATAATNAPLSTIVTPTGGAKDYLWLMPAGWDHTDVITTWSTEFTLSQVQASEGSNGGCGVGVAGRNENAASLTPSVAHTLTGNEQWVCWTVVVHPAPGGTVDDTRRAEVQVTEVSDTVRRAQVTAADWVTKESTRRAEVYVGTYEVEGYTYDKDGVALGSCEVFLIKDNGDDTATFKDQVTSDVSTGYFLFTNIADAAATYFVVAWKDDTPHVFDVTERTVQPAVSPSTQYLYLRSDVDKGEISPDTDLRLRSDLDKVGGVADVTRRSEVTVAVGADITRRAEVQVTEVADFTRRASVSPTFLEEVTRRASVTHAAVADITRRSEVTHAAVGDITRRSEVTHAAVGEPIRSAEVTVATGVDDTRHAEVFVFAPIPEDVTRKARVSVAVTEDITRRAEVQVTEVADVTRRAEVTHAAVKEPTREASINVAVTKDITRKAEVQVTYVPDETRRAEVQVTEVADVTRAAEVTVEAFTTVDITRRAEVQVTEVVDDVRRAEVTVSGAEDKTRKAQVSVAVTKEATRYAKVTIGQEVFTVDVTREAQVSVVVTKDITREATVSVVRGVDITRKARVTHVAGKEPTRKSEVAVAVSVDDTREASVTVAVEEELTRKAEITVVRGADITRKAIVSVTILEDEVRRASVTVLGAIPAEVTRRAIVTVLSGTDATRRAQVFVSIGRALYHSSERHGRELNTEVYATSRDDIEAEARTREND